MQSPSIARRSWRIRFEKPSSNAASAGRVDVSVSVHNDGSRLKTVEIDQALAKQYHAALKKLQKTLGLRGALDISVLAGFRDIVSIVRSTGAMRSS